MASMPKRSLAVRAAWLLGAALQLGLPGAAAWADARLDVAEAHATAHFESHTTHSCARIHPPECALCHYLPAPAVTGRAMLIRFALAASRAPRPAGHAGEAHPQARSHPQPRAPPTLS